jgi:predicted ATPase
MIMKGKVSLTVKNRHITFKLDLERNITIITGDSGTGKTKLINMVRMFSWEGKASGVTLKCDHPCIVLEGNRWETILESTHKSIVFVEESTSFLTSHEFARAIQNTDNYYVFVTRESLSQIPYSVDSIKQIVKNGTHPKFVSLKDKRKYLPGI